MLVGDTHGDFRNVKHKIDLAKQVGDIQRIVVLGDFGLWWGYEALHYIDGINDYAERNNIQVFAIPGNHENYKWWNAAVEGAPAKSQGWAYLRTNVLLSPRVHEFRWGNRQFVVAGGAVSIDKDYRLEYQRRKGKPIWSPDEQLSDEEVERVRQIGFELSGAGRPVDYLLTHDCSENTPWKNRLKPDHDSVIHRRRIDQVLKHLKPKHHFHGHMHEKYDWVNEYTYGYSAFANEPWTGPSTKTFGLECNSDTWSWGVLDLSEDKFTWGQTALAEKLDSQLEDPEKFFELDNNF